MIKKWLIKEDKNNLIKFKVIQVKHALECKHNEMFIKSNEKDSAIN